MNANTTTTTATTATVTPINSRHATPTHTTKTAPNGDVYHFWSGRGASVQAKFFAEANRTRATKMMSGDWTVTVKASWKMEDDLWN
jgi:hypothetical protein